MKASIAAILLTCMILMPAVSQAQINDKLVPHSGFLYEIVQLEDPTNPDAVFNFAYYTINVGTYYALAHKNDVVSVGLDGSLNFGINFPFTGQGVRTTIVTQVPIFAMGRVGALSTIYNQQALGLGVGIGGVYTYFNDVVNFNTGEKVNANFLVPAAVAEATLRSRGNTITVRAHMSLAQSTSLLRGENRQEREFNMGNWGIGLIYSL